MPADGDLRHLATALAAALESQQQLMRTLAEEHGGVVAVLEEAIREGLLPEDRGLPEGIEGTRRWLLHVKRAEVSGARLLGLARETLGSAGPPRPASDKRDWLEP